MPIQLPAPLLPQLASLAQGVSASKLVLFGSRAGGDNRERSDIDLAVFGLDAAQAVGAIRDRYSSPLSELAQLYQVN